MLGLKSMGEGHFQNASLKSIVTLSCHGPLFWECGSPWALSLHVKHFKDLFSLYLKILPSCIEEEEEKEKEAFVNSRGAYTLRISNQPRINTLRLQSSRL
jgi:hypothetical protein